ncbi:MAG: type I methionyl aminopeptidase, partial [Pseudomonadota bacterium]
MPVTIKNAEQQDKMRIAGRLAADVLDMISDYVKPGITTDELNDICHRYITEVQDAIP